LHHGLLGVQLHGADDFTQLVAHLFAHVPLAGPGNLGDPRYAAWAADQLGAEDRAMLEHDAALLARLWAEDPRLDVLHGLVDLHGDLEGFRATANRRLAALRFDEVRDPELLEVLRTLDAAEFVHASLSAMIDAFEKLLEAIEPALMLAKARVLPWLERMVVHVPELDAVPIELVWAMGEHGRALPSRILVGAPAAWNRIDPARAATLAAHEALVRAHPSDDYVTCERWAIAELSERMRGADRELRDAHVAWLNSLDLSGL
jgi:hypothetical protein